MEFIIDFDREVLSLWNRFKCEFRGWNYAKNRQTSVFLFCFVLQNEEKREFYKHEGKSKVITVMKCRIES